MTSIKYRRARGFTLLEIVIAVALFAVVGVLILGIFRGGSQATARGTELQLASMLGARVMDRVISGGYAGLVGFKGQAGDLHLELFGEQADPVEETDPSTGETAAAPPAPAAPVETGVLVLDQIRYRGGYKVDELEPGLLKVEATIAWEHAGAGTGTPPGTLVMTRLVADPTAGSGATGGNP